MTSFAVAPFFEFVVPYSQISMFPPYSRGGRSPSKRPYSRVGAQFVRPRMVLAIIGRDHRFAEEPNSHTPSCSSRKSQCSRVRGVPDDEVVDPSSPLALSFGSGVFRLIAFVCGYARSGPPPVENVAILRHPLHDLVSRAGQATSNSGRSHVRGRPRFGCICPRSEDWRYVFPCSPLFCCFHSRRTLPALWSFFCR